MVYLNFVLFFHKEQLSLKLQTLSNINQGLHDLFPYTVWAIRSKVAARPYFHMVWFRSCPVVDVFEISSQLDLIKKNFEEQENVKILELEENSSFYEILEFCIKAENTINVLNCYLGFLNFALFCSFFI